MIFAEPVDLVEVSESVAVWRTTSLDVSVFLSGCFFIDVAVMFIKLAVFVYIRVIHMLGYVCYYYTPFICICLSTLLSVVIYLHVFVYLSLCWSPSICLCIYLPTVAPWLRSLIRCGIFLANQRPHKAKRVYALEWKTQRSHNSSTEVNGHECVCATSGSLQHGQRPHSCCNLFRALFSSL